MAAVVHETFGYKKDDEIDFSENSGLDEQFTSLDVAPGRNVSVYRKVFYCGAHRFALPEVKVESYNATVTDAYTRFARSVSTFVGQGNVHSPNHPNNYVDSLLNAYVLNAQTPSGRVKLHIANFVTEPCCDRLLILDGNEPLDVLYGEKGSVSLEYYSTGPTMTLLFVTDGSGVRRGWSARFITEYDG